VSEDIKRWLALEEAAADEWGGLGGAEFYSQKFRTARERISTLEALTDQLAEALRRRSKIDWPSDECHCLACDALRAYEADKEAHR
jgi:hypothetical protein